MSKVLKKRFPSEKLNSSVKTAVKEQFNDKNLVFNTTQSNQSKQMIVKSEIDRSDAEESNLNVKKRERSDIIIPVPRGTHANIKFTVNGNGKAIIHVCKAVFDRKTNKLKRVKQIASTTLQ